MQVQKQITIELCGKTDVGCVRKNNEDNFLVADLQSGYAPASELAPISIPPFTRSIIDNRILIAVADGKFNGEGPPLKVLYEQDPKASPKTIDLILKDGDAEHRMLVIYADDGNQLKLCWQQLSHWKIIYYSTKNPDFNLNKNLIVKTPSGGSIA